jgi:MHS family proline/betaine transporter-like MFS transporter
MISQVNKIKSIIVSCFLAGCLEMYDFVLFGFMTPMLYKNYFAYMDKDSALLLSYTLFAVGFLFRPIGSIIFGYIGDVYGRKPALILSVSLMGTASLAMCLLPSFAVIGYGACYLIALIRIIQGISVGGEYNGVTIYAVEHSEGKNIGLIGSLVTIGATMGVLLAICVSRLVAHPSLPEYSWRFAFLLGFGLSIIGYFIRKNLRESPEFQKIRNRKSDIPLLTALKIIPVKFIAAILMAATNIANVYYAMVFVPNYLKDQYTFSIGIVITGLVFIFVPIIGYLSDLFGRQKILFLSSLCIAVFNLFFLNLLIYATSLVQILIIATLAGILVASVVSTVNVMVVEIFPPHCRYSCAAFCYSIGAAIFGGTVPMVCTLIKKWFGDFPLYYGIYLCCISMFGVIAVLILQWQKKSNIKNIDAGQKKPRLMCAET